MQNAWGGEECIQNLFRKSGGRRDYLGDLGIDGVLNFLK
jgi:hypothetical protein